MRLLIYFLFLLAQIYSGFGHALKYCTTRDAAGEAVVITVNDGQPCPTENGSSDYPQRSPTADQPGVSGILIPGETGGPKNYDDGRSGYQTDGNGNQTGYNKDSNSWYQDYKESDGSVTRQWCTLKSDGTCDPNTLDKCKVGEDCDQKGQGRGGEGAGRGNGAGGKSDSGAVEACEAAVSDANDSCSPDGTFNSLGQSMVSQAGGITGMASQDAIAQCKALKLQAAAGLALSGGVTTMCLMAKKSCEDACKEKIDCTGAGEGMVGYNCLQEQKELRRLKKQCEGMTRKMIGAGVLGAGQSANYYAQAKQCEELLKSAGTTSGDPTTTGNTDICSTPQGDDTPGCPGYCLRFPTAPGCNGVGGNECAFNNPTAKDNPNCPALYCPNHPEDAYNCPKAGTGTGTGTGSGPGTSTGSDTDPNVGNFASAPMPSATGGGGLDMPPDDPNGDLYNPNTTGGGNPLAYGANDSNSPGGGGGQGAAPYPGGPNAAPRGKGNPYDKDIDKGFRGGGSGGFSVSGVPLGGAGGGGGFGNGGKDDKLDLSKFLPKDERNPAADELKNAGIAAANDLSNWERISRKMTQKRAVLLPGQANQK